MHAYINADGVDDQVEGFESWYTIADTPPEAPTNIQCFGEGSDLLFLRGQAMSASDGVTGYEIYERSFL